MRVKAAAFVLALLGCQSAASEPSPRQAQERVTVAPRAAPSVAAAEAPPVPRDPAYFKPAPERIVAIGDLHGDVQATRRVLRLAGAIDAKDRWIGGKLAVVQTGDEIDRGDDDRQILDLFDAVADAAQSAGGRVYAMVGNHEIMNASLDFRYVTAGGFRAFADVDTSRVPGAVLQRFEVSQRGRVAAFLPGGPYARRLANRPAVLVLGDTVFVHGGVTLSLARYGVGRFNLEVKKWLLGEGTLPSPASDPEGPLWTRRYSADEAGLDCDGLKAALDALGAARMVVGHTVHTEGITSACGDRVWRIDTGIAGFYRGQAQVLEIQGASVRPLKAAPPPP